MFFVGDRAMLTGAGDSSLVPLQCSSFSLGPMCQCLLFFSLSLTDKGVDRSVEEIGGRCYLTDGPVGGTPTWGWGHFNHETIGLSNSITRYRYAENGDGSLANIKIT